MRLLVILLLALFAASCGGQDVVIGGPIPDRVGDDNSGVNVDKNRGAPSEEINLDSRQSGIITNVSDINRWHVRLPSRGSLNLVIYSRPNALSGISPADGGSLYNAAGELIAYSQFMNLIFSFNFCQVLNAGDYYLEIDNFSEGNYEIVSSFNEKTAAETKCGITNFREWTIDNYGIRNLHAAGVDGSGVNIAIVDSGLEIAHEDLRDNILEGASYNYYDQSDDPTPRLDFFSFRGDHGTSVAGIIGAKAGNGIGLTGVAGNASLYAYNLLESDVSVNLVDSMTRNRNITDISSNSWGLGRYGTFTFVNRFWEIAVEKGLSDGSDGKGISYIFSAGNDRSFDDNANYDEMNNFYGVMSICAVGEDRIVTGYSERGANLWLCGPSNSRFSGVTTTDLMGLRGYNALPSDSNYANLDYTNNFGGTSASAPFVSGVVALMRQVNPQLTWRDVKLILAQTSDLDYDDGNIIGAAVYDGKIAGSEANYTFHHDYGFGIVNPPHAVEAAKAWTLVSGPLVKEKFSGMVNRPIPDMGGGSLTTSITVNNSGISFIEYVEITITTSHSADSSLDITLHSPTGKVSELAGSRNCNGYININGTLELRSCGELRNFRFGSALDLGGQVNGTWTLDVTDQRLEDTGNLENWAIRFFGH